VFTARLKSCPDTKTSFSATSEAVPIVQRMAHLKSQFGQV
jgi:hypothetical protein